MSGVQAGSRLERLLRLQRLLEHEIAQEAARTVVEAAGRHDRPLRITKPAVQRGEDTTQSLLADLGVTARQVKEWAVSVGLAAQVKRGRVAQSLVETYAAAQDVPRGHTPGEGRAPVGPTSQTRGENDG